MLSPIRTLLDEPFRERLDGTLRRSLSGTWSAHTLEADTSSASTDGSQTLVDVQSSPSLPTVAEVAELKRRREFTKSWEKQQEAGELVYWVTNSNSI